MEEGVTRPMVLRRVETGMPPDDFRLSRTEQRD